MDTDADGAVSKQEFTTFGESRKAPQGAGSAAKPSADDLFAHADQDGSGSLSVSDLSAMMAEHETHAAARGGGQKPPGDAPGGGGPPPGGGGRPPSGASASESSSSSSTQKTEPADTNEDGTVSAAEKLIYALTHPEMDDASASSASTS